MILQNNWVTGFCLVAICCSVVWQPLNPLFFNRNLVVTLNMYCYNVCYVVHRFEISLGPGLTMKLCCRNSLTHQVARCLRVLSFPLLSEVYESLSFPLLSEVYESLILLSEIYESLSFPLPHLSLQHSLPILATPLPLTDSEYIIYNQFDQSLYNLYSIGYN